MSTSVSLYFLEDDNGEGLLVQIEGKNVGSVWTAYDCPEDNTISRLGVDSLIDQLVRELGFTVRWQDVDRDEYDNLTNN